jgi:hypothetical protein
MVFEAIQRTGRRVLAHIGRCASDGRPLPPFSPWSARATLLAIAIAACLGVMRPSSFATQECLFGLICACCTMAPVTRSERRAQRQRVWTMAEHDATIARLVPAPASR